MKNRTASTLYAFGLSAAVGLTSIAATAGPVSITAKPEASSSIVLAQGARKGFRRDGDRAYWHGHRGYRHKRPGYRQYNGFWFPLAAFGLGAIIGSSVSRSGTSAHIYWCYGHYRSYRAYDNTYQPYNGPRRPCYSPYG